MKGPAPKGGQPNHSDRVTEPGGKVGFGQARPPTAAGDLSSVRLVLPEGPKPWFFMILTVKGPVPVGTDPDLRNLIVVNQGTSQVTPRTEPKMTPSAASS